MLEVAMDEKEKRKPENIELVKTCEACPEQYDAFDDRKQVGYVRLRWGRFTVNCPDASGEEILSLQIYNNKLAGLFEDDDDREHYLELATKCIGLHYA
jgi:hypothetical protein